jgi:hypothetical protein
MRNCSTRRDQETTFEGKLIPYWRREKRKAYFCVINNPFYDVINRWTHFWFTYQTVILKELVIYLSKGLLNRYENRIYAYFSYFFYNMLWFEYFFVRLWYKCEYIFQRPCIYCLLNIFAISFVIFALAWRKMLWNRAGYFMTFSVCQLLCLGWHRS